MKLLLTLPRLLDATERAAIANNLCALSHMGDVQISFDPWNEFTVAQCLLNAGFPSERLIEERQGASSHRA